MNPLVCAPHVPKAPERGWRQFIEDDAVATAAPHNSRQQGRRQAAKGSLWSKAPDHNPYGDSIAVQQDQQTGPLRPFWLQQQQQPPQQQQDDPAPHLPAQDPPAHVQHTLQQQQQQSRPPQHGHTTHHAQAGTAAPISSAQRRPGGFLASSSDAAAHPPHHAAGAHRTPWAPPPQQQQQQQPHLPQSAGLASSTWQLQPPMQQQPGQQRHSLTKPMRAPAAWSLDSDDDIQLPDSWGPVGASAAAAAPQAPDGGREPQHRQASSRQQQQQQQQRQPQAGQQQQQQQWWSQEQGQQRGPQQQQQVWPQPQQDTHKTLQPSGHALSASQHSTPHWVSQHMQQQHTQPQDPQMPPWQHQQYQAQDADAHKAPWPGQQQQQPAQHQQQQHQQQQQQPQQQHRRTAAASRWSADSLPLSSLSRVPAAAGTPVAGAAAAAGGRQQGGSSRADKGPAAHKKGALAAAAAAGAGGAEAGPGKPRQKGAKAGPKGKGTSKANSSSSSGVTMEFVPKAAGDSSSEQPKLHQSTLFDTIRRAERNRQRAAQPQEEQDEPQQEDEGAAGEAPPTQPAAAAAAAARKRKRSSTAAAAAAGAGSGGAGSIGAASGGAARAGSGGLPRAKKAARRVSKTAAALEAAVEELDTWSLSSHPTAQHGQQQQELGQQAAILDATSAGSAAWQQLQQELTTAGGCALGVIFSRTVQLPPGTTTAAAAAAPLAVQFFTSLQPPYKAQQVLLSKAATYAKRQAAAEAGDAGQDAADAAAGLQQAVGLAVMPVSQGSLSGRAAAAAARPSFFIHLEQQGLPPHVLQLLQAVLCDPAKRPCVCCNAKGVLATLAEQGLQLPAVGRVSIVDPELLAWLLDSQLVQDTKDDACYTLEQQLARQGMQVLGLEELGPLQRLHHQLQLSLQLATRLHTQLSGSIAGQAIRLEMQVAVLLAKMEVAGVACAPSVLSAHRATLAGRLGAIRERATQLLGYECNLSSSQQLAKALYEDLGLAPPAGGGGRGAAKTHLPTNEAALKQLAVKHELPGLVLEHRCIVNVMSKWIDAQWVQQAAAGGRVRSSWQQASTATGRLSSCAPNLQAVTRYTISALDGAEAAGSPSLLTINVRDAFVAPAGKLLLSADYSQVELRLLAHFSEDRLLRQILSQSTGDVFNMIAAALQHAGSRQDGFLMGAGAQGAAPPAAQVSPERREQSKRVTYGIIYGLTSYGLAQQLADHGVTPAAAQGMIEGFLARFSGVQQFMRRAVAAASASGAVSTLMGRRRPIAGLAGDFQERSAAERKVLNSQIQGSAADLCKLAMCAWDEWAAQEQQQQQAQEQQQGQRQGQQQGQPAGQQEGVAASAAGSGGVRARLIAQIHDELLFEVDAPDAVLDPAGSGLQHPGQQFLRVAAAVKRIMEGAAPLAVPLRVKLAWGTSWGSLAELAL